jgi:hypothetical protein
MTFSRKTSFSVFGTKYRYVAVMAILLLTTVLILYLAGGAGRVFLYRQLVFAAVSLALAAIVSNFTEKQFSGPAERFLNLMTGYGLKDRDAEYGTDGVPVVSLRSHMKKFYSPVSVATTGIDYYNTWRKNGDRTQLDHFINCANSLVDNLKVRRSAEGDFGVWEHDYDWTYGLTPPWVSALAQGFGVQLLGYAYAVTGNARYRDAAESAMDAFFVAAKDGGVTYKDSAGEWWYEEYVGKGAVSVRVLNGMIYALIALNEYSRAAGSDRARELFKKGVASLKSNLPSFDAGWWTRYDNLGMVATRNYHRVHLEILSKLCEITGDPEFRATLAKWSKYRRPFFIREFVVQRPSWHDLAILLLNAAAVMVLLEILFIIGKI